jgi:hypothetical protein
VCLRIVPSPHPPLLPRPLPRRSRGCLRSKELHARDDDLPGLQQVLGDVRGAAVNSQGIALLGQLVADDGLERPGQERVRKLLGQPNISRKPEAGALPEPNCGCRGSRRIDTALLISCPSPRREARHTTRRLDPQERPPAESHRPVASQNSSQQSRLAYSSGA